MFINSGFKILESNIEKGHVVKGINTPNSVKSQTWFDKLNQWARDNGQKGLGYVVLKKMNLRTNFK